MCVSASSHAFITGIMNNNSKLLFNQEDEEDEVIPSTPIATHFTHDEQRGFASILLVSGPIVSLSRLVIKGKFKKITVGNVTGGVSAGKHLLKIIAGKSLGQIVQFKVRRNNSYVYFLKKQPVPTNVDERKQFANMLGFFGITLRDYIAKYEEDNEESGLHQEDHTRRGSQDCAPSPPKRMCIEIQGEQS
ncbi:Hypothetical predicted protein [Paramuricea clavata]|uniref:Uncharacterized protein n=1 Tax=Paramuricea clavata TaxID=317549 RepID=A0A7D9E2U5_PARCT|nr:Hypothetical predicted protein [Paramuricea clavata]